MTELEFDAEEWSRLTSSERVRRCLLLAEQASLLGANATPEVQLAYQDLSQHWVALAQEINNYSPDSAGSAGSSP
jgi:hypothetical protein